MNINHIALYVRDLEGVREFFQRFFGADSNGGYHNPKTGLRSYFLSFADGVKLELMSRPDTADAPKELRRTGYIHLSFSAGGKQAVEELTEKLRQAGYPVLDGPRTTGDGFYESLVLGPEENQIEITE